MRIGSKGLGIFMVVATLLGAVYSLPVLSQPSADPTELDTVHQLSSFEDDAELALWTVRAASVALSGERVTHGESSLRVRFGTDHTFPSLRLYTNEDPSLPVDWSAYEHIEMEVWNDEPFAVELFVKFYDLDGDSHDRTKALLPPRQWTRITVPLRTIPLDWTKIESFEVWMWRPNQPVTLHLDNVRLKSKQKEMVVLDTRSILYVSPDGSPNGTGDEDAPLSSIQAALDRAQPGTTIRVRPGLYLERIRFPRGGTAEAPIVLEAEYGAIIDGRQLFEANWEPAPDVAPGVYRARNIPFEARTVVANGRLVTPLWEKRVTPPNHGTGWAWQDVFRRGVPDAGWEGVRALSLYFDSKQELLVYFYPGLDPREMDIVLGSEEPAVTISGVDHVVVRGFIIQNAWQGVYVSNSRGAVIEYNNVGPVGDGVWLAEGAEGVIVRYNELSMKPYADLSRRDHSWHNWRAHKEGGHYDRYGVAIRGTVGYHEIHDNYIHHTFDGISDYVSLDPEVAKQYNLGLRVHHNYLHTLMDDALEPHGSEIDAHWYNNIVINSLVGVRVKRPTHGPLYLYGNIFLDCLEGIRFYGEWEMLPAEVYVFHNTTNSNAAITSNRVFGIGTPNYHVYNNLFYADEWWFNAGGSVTPNWQGDYNVFVKQRPGSTWSTQRASALELGIDANSHWVSDKSPGFRDLAGHDVSLTAESPALGRAIDLLTVFPDLPAREWLANIADGTPDAGALQYGTPMPELPRRQRVHIVAPIGTVSSESIPVAVQLDLPADVERHVSLYVDERLIWEGEDVPADLAIDAWELTAGEHRLTVLLRHGEGGYEVRFSYFTVERGIAFTQPEERRTLSGEVPVALRLWGIPESRVREVVISAHRVDGEGAQGVELYRGGYPDSLEVSTEQLADGTYELYAAVGTVDGAVLGGSVRVSIKNWESLLDEFQPPLPGFLGRTINRDQTSLASAGWGYATDAPEQFFGDAHRRVALTDGPEFLVWEMPSLHRFELTVYAQQPKLDGLLQVDVSPDGEAWSRVEYSVTQLEASENGWFSLEVSGTLPDSAGAGFLRVTLLGSSEEGTVQLGRMALLGRVRH